MRHYISETEVESLALDATNRQNEIAKNGDPDNPHWSKTTYYDKPRERLDGKWITAVDETNIDETQTIETDPQDGTWFTLSDETQTIETDPQDAT
jgi:hypothetical protein